MAGGSTPHASPIDAWREELEENAAARSQASEEQKAANAKVNQDAVLDALPVVGNYRAARRAVDSGELALVHNRNQRSGEFAKHAGLFGADVLGALSPLPFGKLAKEVAKGAKDSAAVFIPAPASKKAEKAFQMRDEGASNPEIAKETRRFFGSEGKLRVEADDYKVPVNLKRFQHGDVAPLQDVFPHHGVFSHHGDLKTAPVRMFKPNTTNAVAYKDPNGTLALPLTGDEKWSREQLAKLVQYNLAEKAGFSRAVTHNPQDTLKDYTETIRRVQDIIDNPKPGDDIGAALAWREHAEPMFKRLQEAATNPDFSKFNRLSKRFGGNLDARAVRSRSEGANKVYPYDAQQWLATTAIPHQTSTRDELAEFLANWKNYGVGRDLFGDK